MEIMSLSAITFITMKDLLFFCSGDMYSFVTFGSFLFYCLAEQKSPDQNHPAVFPQCYSRHDKNMPEINFTIACHLSNNKKSDIYLYLKTPREAEKEGNTINFQTQNKDFTEKGYWICCIELLEVKF